MGTWIDFKQLREQLDLGDVLRHYGVQLKANAAGQHHGRCPLPGHPKDNTSLSFSANLRKKIWRCFSCGGSGNVLDLGVLLEGGNPKNPDDVRRVAILLRDRFLGGYKAVAPSNVKTVVKRKNVPDNVTPREAMEKSATNSTTKELVNAPLDFALKNLSNEHAYFRKHGFLPATIEHFGLGYCTKGMFAGRIAIPIHNREGQLVGYTGKLTDEFEVTAEQPEYLWPGTRKHNGVKYVFDRSQILYHAHCIEQDATDLVVVQSPESAWWVWQAGFPYVVAIMAEAPSPAQSALIVQMVRRTGRVWTLTDGNKAGDRCAHDILEDVGTKRFCSWLRLTSGRPEDRTPEELAAMLEWKV